MGYTKVGGTQTGREFSYQKYRYGFNKQEKDGEMGDYYSFEYRVHDARLGRFLSVDPLSAKYPWNSSYAFAENRVIDGNDLEGAEYVTKTTNTFSAYKQNTAYQPEKNASIAGKDATALATVSYIDVKATLENTISLAQRNCREMLNKGASSNCDACANARYYASKLPQGDQLFSGQSKKEEIFNQAVAAMPEFDRGMIVNNPVTAVEAVAIVAVVATPVIVAEATAGVGGSAGYIVGKMVVEGAGQLAVGGYENLDPISIGMAGFSSPGFKLATQSLYSWKPFKSNDDKFKTVFGSGANNKSIESAGVDLGFGAIGYGLGGGINKIAQNAKIQGPVLEVFKISLGAVTSTPLKAIRQTVKENTGK